VPVTNAVSVSDLPATMKSYVEFINNYLGVDVHYISNGPGRDQLVHVG
jgi:adenylosuccinate synthase